MLCVIKNILCKYRYLCSLVIQSQASWNRLVPVPPHSRQHTHTHLALFLTSCHQISMLLGVFACVYVLPPHIHPNQPPSNVRRNNEGVDSPCAAVAALFRNLLPCCPPSLTWEYPLPTITTTTNLPPFLLSKYLMAGSRHT